MKYISYGSNMNLDQMAYRCPNSEVYGTGIVVGWKLRFNYHADIVETGNEEDYVPVVVWNLDEGNDLKSLDYYEGYPAYYTKKNIDVVMDGSGEVVNAMVYVMIDERKGVFPPTVEYFEGIKEGYRANGIYMKPLYRAVDECVKQENITKYNQYNPRGKKKKNKRQVI